MVDEDSDFIDDEENEKFEDEIDLKTTHANGKRDFRSEIEKKLELIELKKITGDNYYYDDIFD